MEHKNYAAEHRRRFSHAPLIAVLVAHEPDDAVAACRALAAGGVPAVELALRTPRALDCIEAVAAEVPEILAVAGTVLATDQLDELHRRGVQAAVAPGCNRAVVEHALGLGMSFAPGVCTPSDIEVALECGCTLLKFFPAEPSGGLEMLKSMAGPYAHLGLQFIPLGGLREQHVASYLADGAIFAVGGTWIASSDLVTSRDWTQIESRARSAAQSAASVSAASGGTS